MESDTPQYMQLPSDLNLNHSVLVITNPVNEFEVEVSKSVFFTCLSN